MMGARELACAECGAYRRGTDWIGAAKPHSLRPLGSCKSVIMDGYQRIRSALRGERPDSTPVMLHNFMMAAREAGITMRQFRQDPRAICRAFTVALENYGYDGIVVDVDTATLAGAVGVPVDFPEDLPARCAGCRLNRLEEVQDLPPVDVTEYWGVQVWLEGTRLLRSHFGNEVFIRGNCDQAPFSLACAMRSIEAWMLDVANAEKRPLVQLLLEYCTAACTQFIRLMAESGAHIVSNGDSPAGPEMVSPTIYRELALPFERRIIECAHSVGMPHFLHICGKTNRILEDMVSTGADGLELDFKTDVRLAHDVLKDKAVFIGNIDPSGVLALSAPRLVEQKTRELLDIFADTPRFILNAGCAIPSETPPENLRAMIRVAREASAL
jgi:MtaA/CmuA family methyltransferase